MLVNCSIIYITFRQNIFEISYDEMCRTINRYKWNSLLLKVRCAVQNNIIGYKLYSYITYRIIRSQSKELYMFENIVSNPTSTCDNILIHLKLRKDPRYYDYSGADVSTVIDIAKKMKFTLMSSNSFLKFNFNPHIVKIKKLGSSYSLGKETPRFYECNSPSVSYSDKNPNIHIFKMSRGSLTVIYPVNKFDSRSEIISKV